MEGKYFPGEINLFSSLILIILPLTIIIIIFKQTKSQSATQNLPPGPHPWPIIGNILHLGKKPHISLSHFAHIHGPLISLKLGTRLLVAASTPAAATQILKTHDRLLSARYLPKAADPKLHPMSLVWAAECSDHWKTLRSMCRNEFFSNKAIESQSSLREKKVAEMVSFLDAKHGKQVKIGEIVFATIFNILGNICFSKDFLGLSDEDEGAASGLKGTMWKIMEMGATPNICDFYPVFERLDPQRLRKRFKKLVDELFGVWDVIIKERRETRKGNDSATRIEEDFLDVMLNSGFSDLQIHVLALELFSAGTETTSATIEWAISELLKNREASNRLCEELNRQVSPTTTINESHISQFPYLHACVKETLRLHPPVPFLIPHNALETCEVMNYTIPKGSQVIVNLWAVGRDPNSWEDPFCFRPERFMDSDLDFKGQDFEFLPFGAGRRMCPGIPLATKQVHFILATLFHNFELSLADGKDPCELDMSEKFGITLQREQPLRLIPKRKLVEDFVSCNLYFHLASTFYVPVNDPRLKV